MIVVLGGVEGVNRDVVALPASDDDRLVCEGSLKDR